MLSNFIKIAWRNLLQSKLYSAINITGLAIGLTVCMMIMLYLGHEWSFDRFHKNAQNIFLITGKVKMGGDSMTMLEMSYPAAPMVKSAEPSVKSIVRLKTEWRSPIVSNTSIPDRKYVENKFIFADPNFFSFFSFPLLQGNKSGSLRLPFTVIISRSASKKYFGNDNPIGKILRYNNQYNFTVTGISENIPSNSTIHFDMVASMSSLASMDDEKDFVTGTQVVQGGAFLTFFQTVNSGGAQKLEHIFQQLADRQGDKTTRYVAMPLATLHLQSNLGDSSTSRYLGLFSWVAGLVLLLALTSYVSMSTARSAIRAKEIGVRKAMGAARKTIAGQFFVESALYAAIAFALALIICTCFQQKFLGFLGLDIDQQFLFQPAMLLSFAGLFLLTIFLAASYPALLLSAFNPVQALYNRWTNNNSSLNVRRFTTVFQFVISVGLIICSIVIAQQMHFFRTRPTGINRENIVMIPFSSVQKNEYANLKKEMSSVAGITGITASRYAMYTGTDALFIHVDGSSSQLSLPMLKVDENFIPMLGIRWKIPPPDSAYIYGRDIVAINEAAISKMNLPPNPVGQSFYAGDTKIKIGAVVKDFNYTSLHQKIDALCLFLAPDTASVWNDLGGNLFAKIQPNSNMTAVISELKSIYEKIDPQTPFQYKFMDENFEAMYKAETNLSKIFTVFTGLTVLIACLGLFGLATFSAQQRKREIGIRKVLGASVSNVVTLLSKDFLRLVLVAIIISAPMAWWAMNQWLQNFAYHVHITGWVFLLTSLLAISIAFISVGFQALKAAVKNPVDSLRMN